MNKIGGMIINVLLIALLGLQITSFSQKYYNKKYISTEWQEPIKSVDEFQTSNIKEMVDCMMAEIKNDSPLYKYTDVRYEGTYFVSPEISDDGSNYIVSFVSYKKDDGTDVYDMISYAYCRNVKANKKGDLYVNEYGDVSSYDTGTIQDVIEKYNGDKFVPIAVEGYETGSLNIQNYESNNIEVVEENKEENYTNGYQSAFTEGETGGAYFFISVPEGFESGIVVNLYNYDTKELVRNFTINYLDSYSLYISELDKNILYIVDATFEDVELNNDYILDLLEGNIYFSPYVEEESSVHMRVERKN